MWLRAALLVPLLVLTGGSLWVYHATEADFACAPGEPTPPQELPAARLVRFRWSYAGRDWSFAVSVPTAAYSSFYERPRVAGAANFAAYVTDPGQAAVLDAVVAQVREAAAAHALSRAETVGLAACFVQSLAYVPDKVGTGFDDYPKYPLETLHDRGGDCEDTAILLAAILKGLGHDAVLLEVPHTARGTGHMAVGVAMPAGFKGDSYQKEGGGARYFYVETTASGYGVGEAPPVVKGRPVRVLSLVPQATLSGLAWTALEVVDGRTHLRATVQNLGSEPARNLVVSIGYDAGANRTWSEEQSLPVEVGMQETATVDLWVPPPPPDQRTRLVGSAWADNAAAVTAAGDWFTS